MYYNMLDCVHLLLTAWSVVDSHHQAVAHTRRTIINPTQNCAGYGCLYVCCKVAHRWVPVIILLVGWLSLSDGMSAVICVISHAQFRWGGSRLLLLIPPLRGVLFLIRLIPRLRLFPYGFSHPRIWQWRGCGLYLRAIRQYR